MQWVSRDSVAFAGAILLGLVSEAVAHGDDGDMNMGEPSRPTVATGSTAPESYWQYGEDSGILVAHIALMTLAWVFILPIGVMISIVRSRYTMLIQCLFLAVNATGLLLATMYNARNPELYPGAAHYKLGWIVTWIACAQLLMGVISAYAGRNKSERGAFLPVSREAIAEHQRIHEVESYRYSNDSGQGTEPNTESLRSQSISSQRDVHLPDIRMEYEEEDLQEEKHGLLHGTKVDRFLSKRVPGLLSSRALRVLNFFYDAIDRVILVLDFVALMTGIVTYGGFFMGDRVFSGLAHWIKGGIFFWYGILTLGRWAGCFADIGWSWNIKPSKTNAPSGEFVESFLIFLYGITNVWMEHLAAWGAEWSAQDLEHISITFMFFGGGLCGMLIESKRVRDVLNVTKQASVSLKPESLEEPKSYQTSMNPIPAMIILLLGMTMSSHHQETMVSTMIHKQWGMLLVGAAFARATTYILLYLAPPSSILPGRPPTELITAFCLMAGGMIFMASARDTVIGLETNELDAMFVFTVAIGLITFLMAWIILVIAVKGWVLRRESRLA